jgi:hypothetical protein
MEIKDAGIFRSQPTWRCWLWAQSQRGVRSDAKFAIREGCLSLHGLTSVWALARTDDGNSLPRPLRPVLAIKTFGDQGNACHKGIDIKLKTGKGDFWLL